MPNKLVCGCCSCQDACNGGVDTFDTARDSYLTYTNSSAVFTTTGGFLNLADQSYAGSYYRNLSVGSLIDLRVGVSGVQYSVEPPSDGDTTMSGIFIGGVARLYNVCAKVGIHTTCRTYLEVGCDAYGYYSGATPIDLGVGLSGFQGMGITIGQDPFASNHYWMQTFWQGFGGNYFALDLTASIGSTINVGVMGSGLAKWDNLCVVLNHLNRTRCHNCSAGTDSLGTPTRIFDLSVPAMDNGSCLCSQLSGDYELKYHEYFNTACAYQVGCCWVTDEEAGVVCPPYEVCTTDNRKWIVLNGGGTLRGTGKWDVLEYTLVGTFDPIGPNTYNYSCTVCDGACSTHPSTLTITPHV